jgi:hypothetical protein
MAKQLETFVIVLQKRVLKTVRWLRGRALPSLETA